MPQDHGSALIERAPAKINLTLHILRRREDGFHDLESLVAFAGGGDVLSLQPDAPLGLTLEGPTAAASGDVGSNLVLRACENLRARVPDLRAGAFHLVKRLPVAAGVGGGSSDAAAALRLLARLNDMPADDPRILDAAALTGSDVPVCIGRQARMMRGRGETLGEKIALPPLFAVLVNPGTPLVTGDVFARIGLRPGEDHGYGAHLPVPQKLSTGDLLSLLKRSRNDMEDAASVLAPVVVHVIAVLSAARGCRLARMSGSGATCFGLFEERRAATRAATVIRRDHPDWWVTATLLR